MTKGHFTLNELRACAKGDDESLISSAVAHCRWCKECGDQLAMLLALNRLDVHRVGGTPHLLAAVVKRAVITAALLAGLAIAIVQFTSTSPTHDPDLRSLATIEPPPLAMVKFQLGTISRVGNDDTWGRLQFAGQVLASGQLRQATAELEQLHTKRPLSRVIAGYLGIALYLSGDDSIRVRELLAAGTLHPDRAIAGSSKWYLANYLVRSGDAESARPILAELAVHRDLRGRQSTELLAQLDAIGHN